MKSLGFIVLLLTLTLAVYRLTASPTVGWVDSGVIATAATTLGIANPPGFPLYMLVGHLFTKVPIGSVVARLEFFSHLSAIGILILVFFIVRGLVQGKHRNLIGLFASTALAFSYNFWSQAINVETYSFTNFVLFLLLFAAAEVARPNSRVLRSFANAQAPSAKNSNLSVLTAALISFFAFFLGLAMGTNPIIAGLLPAIAWLLWIQRRFVAKHAAPFALAGALFVVGVILIYSYLPMRAGTHPFLDWGDPVTFDRIQKHLMGSGLNIYEPATRSVNGFTGQPSVWLESFLHYWFLALLQFMPLLFLLVIVGWFRLKKLNTPLFWTLTILLIGNLTFVTMYYGGNQESWMITSFIVMAIFLGVGANDAVAWISAQKREFFRHATVVFFSLALLPLFFWYPIVNRSKHAFADDYIMNMYRSLPQGAVVIGGGDYFQSATVYAHEVTKYRPDIIPITGNMFYIFYWYRSNLAINTKLVVSEKLEKMIQYKTVDEFTDVVDELIAENPTRQFYVTPLLLRDTVVAGHKDGNYHTKKYQLLPFGLLYKVIPLTSNETPDEKLYDFTFANPSTMNGPSPFYLERNYKGAYQLLRNSYAVADVNLANYYASNKQPDKALVWYKKAVSASTDESGEFLHTLAIFYAEANQLDLAKTYFEKSLAREPTNADMIANYQTFLKQEDASRQGSQKMFTGKQFTFKYPQDWIATARGASVVITDPTKAFTITISMMNKPAGQSAEDFLALQKQAYGTLVNQGLAQIPGMDYAYLKIWKKSDAQLFEFFLFQKNSVFEVTVAPPDGPLMRAFDGVVSSLKAL